MSVYAWLMLATFVGPFLLSFDKKVAFYKTWRPLLIGIVINAIIFIGWDVWFVKRGVWGFNEQYVWQQRLFGLPIEEWLFFIVVPYAGVFIYACLKAYLKAAPFAKTKNSISWLALALVLLVLFFNTDKTYTFSNCVVAAIVLASQLLYFKSSWLGYFWLAYIIQLLPFLLINGILTGAITTSPIVWYNNNEIIGIRLFTIPIEDTIYALTCLLIPITFYERYRKP